MSEEIKSDFGHVNEAGQLIVEGKENFDISLAQDFYTALKEALPHCQSVQFDFSEVQRIDTSILQLLTAFVQDAQTNNIPIEWKDPSEVFSNNAETLGLTDALALG